MPVTHRIRLHKEEACVMVGYRTLVSLVMLAVVLSLSACVATFREGPFQPPASWPITTASGKQSLSLLISGETISEDVHRLMYSPLLKEYRDSFPAGKRLPT